MNKDTIAEIIKFVKSIYRFINMGYPKTYSVREHKVWRVSACYRAAIYIALMLATALAYKIIK